LTSDHSLPSPSPKMASASSSSSRPESTFSPLPELAKGFMLKGITRNYNHQYANMYFSRLSELSRPVKQRAKSKWEHAKGESHGDLTGKVDFWSRWERARKCISLLAESSGDV